MMKPDIKYFLFINVMVAFLVSCKKKELPVPKHEAGNVITATINMESNYKFQTFFNLENNTVVGQNLKTSWDLGFEASPNGYRVILNTAKAMYACNKGNVNFGSVTDTSGFSLNKKWDQPTGNMDSTAIGDWRNSGNVYIIDRGYDENGTHRGFKKMVLENVNSTKYTLRFASLNGTSDNTITINKDSTYNFTFLSLSNNGQVTMVEPPKADWDLCFTQYLHIFYNPLQPYLVTGCLQNRFNTLSVMDSLKTFSQISFADISTHSLSQNINTIGYEWKFYTGGVYITYQQMNYIIQDSKGRYYKFHFVDFYNPSGVKGNPKWEFQKL